MGIINALGKDNVEIVGYSEIDKYASMVYKYHWPNEKNHGDITKIKTEELPDFDLLVGGPSCQSWSIAGKRGGFEDDRGNMWFEFGRILKDKQPKYFLAENVKGLLSHEQGDSMETICVELSQCGYAIDFEVLNSKYFGVPQNRERVFIFGIRKDLIDKEEIISECNRRIEEKIVKQPGHQFLLFSVPSKWDKYSFVKRYFGRQGGSEVFPIGRNCEKNNGIQQKKGKEGAWISCLSTRYGQRWSGESYIADYRSDEKDNYILEPQIYNKHIAERSMGKKTDKWNGGGNIVTDHVPCLNQSSGQDYIVHNMQPRSGDPSKGGTGHLSNDKGLSPILNATKEVRTEEAKSIRRLTPTECEKLQSFPVGWTQYGLNENGETVEISDSRRYKALGNAVTTSVIKAIFQQFKKYIDGEYKL